MPVTVSIMNGQFGTALMWLGLMLVLLLIEILTVNLTTIWFALGALAALISSLFRAPFWLQVIWFFVVSILALVCTKPLVKKYVNGKAQPTNADMVIGKTCVVTEPVDNLRNTGAVTVGGRTWTARSENGDVFAPGERVVARKIEGVKLIISAPEPIDTQRTQIH